MKEVGAYLTNQLLFSIFPVLNIIIVNQLWYLGLIGIIAQVLSEL